MFQGFYSKDSENAHHLKWREKDDDEKDSCKMQEIERRCIILVL